MEKELMTCPECGKEFDSTEYVIGESGNLICPKCAEKEEIQGMTENIKKETCCTICGFELPSGSNHCPKCAQKNITNPKSNRFTAAKTILTYIRKKSISQKIIFAVCAIMILTALIFTSSKLFPAFFSSTEDLLAEADYKRAYRKAGRDDKINVLKENLYAKICEDVKNILKNPESFYLRSLFVSKDGDIVCCALGENEYGGNAEVYTLFTYNDSMMKYDLMGSTDMNTESKYSKYEYDKSKYGEYENDDTAFGRLARKEKQKAIENAKARAEEAALKAKIYRIIVSYNPETEKVESDMTEEVEDVIIDRLNGLQESGLLKNIILLDDIETIYPQNTDEEPK